jgi:PAS domain-containing protein/DNA-binding CsgD family transcriptional regulator
VIRTNADDIAALSDALYGAVYDDRRWPEAMALCRDWLNATDASFGMVDLARDLAVHISGGCTPEFTDSFLDPELDNPTMSLLAGGRVGERQTDALVPAWTRGTFYNEWCRPQGAHSYLQIKLWQHGDVLAHIAFLRGGRQPKFDDDSQAFLDQMVPILGRVAQLRQQMGAMRLGGRADVLDQMDTGLAVVDERGRLLYVNRLAEAFLGSQRHGIDAVGGRLTLARRNEKSRLRALIAGAAGKAESAGGDLLASPPEEGQALVLSVAPLPDAWVLGLPVGRAALVLMRNATVVLGAEFEMRTAALFGFSEREAQLARVLANGGAVADYVAERGVRMPTARTQLTHLLQKTGTRRQGELVSLLLSALPRG